MTEQTTPITAGADYVTLINVFTVKPQDQDRLVRLLVDATDAVMSRFPAYLRQHT